MSDFEIPADFVQNVNRGWNLISGFVYPLAFLSIPAALIAYYMPTLAIWSPFLLIVAYLIWLAFQYHIGTLHDRLNANVNSGTVGGVVKEEVKQEGLP